MRTSPLVMAAAAAVVASFALVPSIPSARADQPCGPQPADWAQVEAFMACLRGKAAQGPQQQQRAAAPTAPAGPCGPNVALGINGTCGFQAAQCGVGGVDRRRPLPRRAPTRENNFQRHRRGHPAPGIPAGGLPQIPGPAVVPQAPGLNQINNGQPVQAPPECANLDYFIVNRIMCEQLGSPIPPGYTYGMNDTPPA